jgi:hypothetical protein
MPRFFRRPIMGGSLAILALCVSVSTLAHGASPSAKAERNVVAQPLFEAMAAGDLEANVVPRDAKQLTIQLKNKTERPLTIQMPPALAAAPILAQQPQGLFPGPFNNNNGPRNNNQQAPQQLGMGGGQGNQGGGLGQPGGIFNIPAGRVIKIKAECVCLEYGKPDPDARMKYELKPLGEVNDSPALAKVLQSLGDELVDQRVAQAAAWHITNDLSWNQLAGLVGRHLGGTKEMQFKTGEVAAAKALVEKIETSQRAADDRQRISATAVRK